MDLDYTRDDFRTLPWTPAKGIMMAAMLLDMREALLDAREAEDCTELIELCALVKVTYDFLKNQIDEALNKDEE